MSTSTYSIDFQKSINSNHVLNPMDSISKTDLSSDNMPSKLYKHLNYKNNEDSAEIKENNRTSKYKIKTDRKNTHTKMDDSMQNDIESAFLSMLNVSVKSNKIKARNISAVKREKKDNFVVSIKHTYLKSTWPKLKSMLKKELFKSLSAYTKINNMYAGYSHIADITLDQIANILIQIFKDVAEKDKRISEITDGEILRAIQTADKSDEDINPIIICGFDKISDPKSELTSDLIRFYGEYLRSNEIQVVVNNLYNNIKNNKNYNIAVLTQTYPAAASQIKKLAVRNTGLQEEAIIEDLQRYSALNHALKLTKEIQAENQLLLKAKVMEAEKANY